MLMVICNIAPTERVAVGSQKVLISVPSQVLIPTTPPIMTGSAEKYYAVNIRHPKGDLYLVYIYEIEDGEISAKVIYTTSKSPVIHELKDFPLGFMQEYKEQIPPGAWYAPFAIELDRPLYELYIPAGSILEAK